MKKEFDNSPENQEKDGLQPEQNEAMAENEREDVLEQEAEQVEKAAEAAVEAATEEVAEAVDEVVEALEPTGEEPPKKEKKAKSGKKKEFNSRKLRYGGMATAVTAVAIVLVVVLNVVVGILADRFPLNLDLTQNKQFTLSEESVAIAKGIQKDIQILVFADEEYFKNPNTGSEEADAIYREFYTAVQQYQSYSGGKVTTQYIDLNKNPTLSTDYKKYEPAAGDIVVVCGDRYKKMTFSDLYEAEAADEYGYSYTYYSLVEKALATRMKVVTAESDKVITFFVGHGEDDNLVQGMQNLYELNGYETKEVNLSSSAEIDKNTVAAIIAAPENDYTANEIERLRKWMQNDGELGRNLMVFTNPTASCPNLFEYLNVGYGLEVTNNIIQETDLSRMYQYNQLMVFGDVEETDYTPDAAGEGTVLGMTVRQILTHKENSTDQVLYNVDLLTYPETAKLLAMNNEEEGASTEAVDAEEYPVIGMAAAVEWDYNSDNEMIQNHVVVCGSPAVGYQDFLQLSTVKNEELMLNTMQEMTGVEGEEITISGKSLTQDTISFAGGTITVVGFGVLTIGVPVVILIVALVVFLRRRHL